MAQTEFYRKERNDIMFESKHNRENGFETVEPNNAAKAGKVLGGLFGTIALLFLAVVVVFGSIFITNCALKLVFEILETFTNNSFLFTISK